MYGQNIAANLELEHKVVKGSMQILYKAIQKQWDRDYSIVGPGESVDYYHLGHL